MRKVFLFGANEQDVNKGRWLYCSNVEFKDGIWSGWIINGNYKFEYDTATNIYSHRGHKQKVELSWSTDAADSTDYNDILSQARGKYFGEKYMDNLSF